MKLLTTCLILGLLLLVAPLAHACNPQFSAPLQAPMMTCYQQQQTVQVLQAPQPVYSMQQFAQAPSCGQASFRVHSFAAPAPQPVFIPQGGGFLGASAGNASAGIGIPAGGSFVNNGKIKIKNGRGAGRIR